LEDEEYIQSTWIEIHAKTVFYNNYYTARPPGSRFICLLLLRTYPKPKGQSYFVHGNKLSEDEEYIQTPRIEIHAKAVYYTNYFTA
jgi:hypothetical protein